MSRINNNNNNTATSPHYSDTMSFITARQLSPSPQSAPTTPHGVGVGNGNGSGPSRLRVSTNTSTAFAAAAAARSSSATTTTCTPLNSTAATMSSLAHSSEVMRLALIESQEGPTVLGSRKRQSSTHESDDDQYQHSPSLSSFPQSQSGSAIMERGSPSFGGCNSAQSSSPGSASSSTSNVYRQVQIQGDGADVGHPRSPFPVTPFPHLSYQQQQQQQQHIRHGQHPSVQPAVTHLPVDAIVAMNQHQASPHRSPSLFHSAPNLISDDEGIRNIITALANAVIQAASTSSRQGSPIANNNNMSRTNSGELLLPPSAAMSSRVSVERGIKTFDDLPGVELYLYQSYAHGASAVQCSRTRFVRDWNDMIGMSEVRRRLEEMVGSTAAMSAASSSALSFENAMAVPTMESMTEHADDNDQRTLFISGPRQGGAATAVHLFCRLNAINLVDCHMSSPLPERYDWRLETIVREHRPCILMMHRFDTLWEDAYRWNTLAHLRDRWQSIERQGLPCWLVWVINGNNGEPPNVSRIQPLYSNDTTPHVPACVQLDNTFASAEDVARFGRLVMNMRGVFRVTQSDGLVVNDQHMAIQQNFQLGQAIAYFDNTICLHTHILCAPGRVVKLIDKAIALSLRSASSMPTLYASAPSSSTAAATAATAATPSLPMSNAVAVGGHFAFGNGDISMAPLTTAMPVAYPLLTVNTLKAAFAHISQTSQRLNMGFAQ